MRGIHTFFAFHDDEKNRMDLYDAKHRVVSGPVFSVAYIDLPHAELGTWFAVRGLNEAHYSGKPVREEYFAEDGCPTMRFWIQLGSKRCFQVEETLFLDIS